MPVNSLDPAVVYHIVGVGGVGMSCLALLMHYRGYRVSGSDQSYSGMIGMLRSCGIPVTVGHGSVAVRDVDVIARSSAVGDDNIEVAAAISSGKRVISRAELLSMLMVGDFKTICVSGSHGKTTTTAMIGSILQAAGMEPTVVCGATINGTTSGLIYGSGAWMVVEADESDKTCIALPRNVSVLTNVDNEHSDWLGGYDGVKDIFRTFVDGTKDFAVLCRDDEYCSSIARSNDYLYSVNGAADLTASDIRFDGLGMLFNIDGALQRKDCAIPSLGLHNVSNALAAALVCHNIGISTEHIINGLANYPGTGRRLEFLGSIGGVLVYDDYAHHPSEIKATLSAARHLAGGNKLVAILQPHRFGRLSNCFDGFLKALAAADVVAVTHVYAAGEKAEDFGSISSLDLVNKMPSSVLLEDDHAIMEFVRRNTNSGDVVIFMGAGDITHTARRIYESLIY